VYNPTPPAYVVIFDMAVNKPRPFVVWHHTRSTIPEHRLDAYRIAEMTNRITKH
jgi:hypothetical protein